MSTLPTWTERPEVTANLLNPAFCSEVIRECVNGYQAEAGEGLPFALSFLVLPLILNNRIRERLPKTKSTPVHAWINEREDLRVGLARQVSGFVPFSREAIMFGAMHGTISIADSGLLEAKGKSKIKTEDTEIKSCLSKSGTLGKVLARSGTPATIYSLLGVKP
jgi:hypothetical protein